MKKTKLLTHLVILFLLFVAPVLYFSLSWRKIRVFCEHTTVGSNIAQVRQRAKIEGFRIGEIDNLLLISGPGFGRAVCEITVKKTKVSAVEYVFLD